MGYGIEYTDGAKKRRKRRAEANRKAQTITLEQYREREARRAAGRKRKEDRPTASGTQQDT